ncbi:MAG: TonB-dependent receptor [Pseudomonadota bacterium]|nr:TonB-dependent receptor [Pseudomonadota bacterium]
MYRLMSGVSVIAMSGLIGINAAAQTADAEVSEEKRLQSVTVTATKRSESAQSIPVAVEAIGEQELEQLGVKNFNDYLIQLPGVTAGGSGPGQNTIYIRGLASTTPAATIAGVAGLAPNVSFYLDEQPLAQPGRNLDVYAADLQRVEVLSGPQGTLFGASSQAGTVRLITNKPDLSGFDASVKASTSFTEGGEMSNSVEAMLNVPITDKFALRGVVYNDRQGGYIDNVGGTVTAAESARFRPAGTVRDNGLVVSAGRAGFQAGADLSGVTFIPANNSSLVENNFNDTVYSGFRLSGTYEFNSDWSLLVSHAQQQLDTEGVFFADPELDDYDIERFSEDDIEDRYHNTSWTLEGRIGMLEALYTGAYTDRTTDQTVDYTDYLFVGQYLPYYICDGAVTYPGAAGPTGTCQAPNLFVDSLTELKVETHELRFNTPAENRLHATFGGFYSDLELLERNDFTYPGSRFAIGFNGVAGFPDNYPLTNTAVTGAIGSAQSGFFSDPGPFPEGVIFRNDVLRTDEQVGLFGEATFDLNEQFSVTFGARWYDIEVDLEGSANSSFFNLGQATDQQRAGTNISAQFAPNNAFGAPDTASTDGVIYKLTGSWTPTDDTLFYATYSEGFRPGLLNRPGGRTNPAGTYTVPFAVDTDDIQNYELGWKTELFDNSLRFNGSAFFVEIEGLQATIFDPSIVNLFFSDNAANAEITGIEGDFTWAPYSIDGLTIAGAFSLLDTEITDVLVPTNDVLAGSDLAFAPAYQGNLRARYEWDLEREIAGSSLTAHVMPQIVFSDDSVSDIVEINKGDVDGYVTIGATLGVTADQWSAELFGTNLTGEYAELSNSFQFDRNRVTPMRPRTVGVRVGYDF